jgi:hypothetical protein
VGEGADNEGTPINSAKNAKMGGREGRTGKRAGKVYKGRWWVYLVIELGE